MKAQGSRERNYSGAITQATHTHAHMYEGHIYIYFLFFIFVLRRAAQQMPQTHRSLEAYYAIL
jgi:hypothetical protein